MSVCGANAAAADSGCPAGTMAYAEPTGPHTFEACCKAQVEGDVRRRLTDLLAKIQTFTGEITPALAMVARFTAKNESYVIEALGGHGFAAACADPTAECTNVHARGTPPLIVALDTMIMVQRAIVEAIAPWETEIRKLMASDLAEAQLEAVFSGVTVEVVDGMRAAFYKTLGEFVRQLRADVAGFDVAAYDPATPEEAKSWFSTLRRGVGRHFQSLIVSAQRLNVVSAESLLLMAATMVFGMQVPLIGVSAIGGTYAAIRAFCSFYSQARGGAKGLHHVIEGLARQYARFAHGEAVTPALRAQFEAIDKIMADHPEIAQGAAAAVATVSDQYARLARPTREVPAADDVMQHNLPAVHGWFMLFERIVNSNAARLLGGACGVTAMFTPTDGNDVYRGNFGANPLRVIAHGAGVGQQYDDIWDYGFNSLHDAVVDTAYGLGLAEEQGWEKRVLNRELDAKAKARAAERRRRAREEQLRAFQDPRRPGGRRNATYGGTDGDNVTWSDMPPTTAPPPTAPFMRFEPPAFNSSSSSGGGKRRKKRSTAAKPPKKRVPTPAAAEMGPLPVRPPLAGKIPIDYRGALTVAALMSTWNVGAIVGPAATLTGAPVGVVGMPVVLGVTAMVLAGTMLVNSLDLRSKESKALATVFQGANLTRVTSAARKAFVKLDKSDAIDELMPRVLEHSKHHPLPGLPFSGSGYTTPDQQIEQQVAARYAIYQALVTLSAAWSYAVDPEEWDDVAEAAVAELVHRGGVHLIRQMVGEGPKQITATLDRRLRPYSMSKSHVSKAELAASVVLNGLGLVIVGTELAAVSNNPVDVAFTRAIAPRLVDVGGGALVVPTPAITTTSSALALRVEQTNPDAVADVAVTIATALVSLGPRKLLGPTLRKQYDAELAFHSSKEPRSILEAMPPPARDPRAASPYTAAQWFAAITFAVYAGGFAMAAAGSWMTMAAAGLTTAAATVSIPVVIEQVVSNITFAAAAQATLRHTREMLTAAVEPLVGVVEHTERNAAEHEALTAAVNGTAVAVVKQFARDQSGRGLSANVTKTVDGLVRNVTEQVTAVALWYRSMGGGRWGGDDAHFTKLTEQLVRAVMKYLLTGAPYTVVSEATRQFVTHLDASKLIRGAVGQHQTHVVTRTVSLLTTTLDTLVLYGAQAVSSALTGEPLITPRAFVHGFAVHTPNQAVLTVNLALKQLQVVGALAKFFPVALFPLLYNRFLDGLPAETLLRALRMFSSETEERSRHNLVDALTNGEQSASWTVSLDALREQTFVGHDVNGTRVDPVYVDETLWGSGATPTAPPIGTPPPTWSDWFFVGGGASGPPPPPPPPPTGAPTQAPTALPTWSDWFGSPTAAPPPPPPPPTATPPRKKWNRGMDDIYNQTPVDDDDDHEFVNDPNGPHANETEQERRARSAAWDEEVRAEQKKDEEDQARWREENERGREQARRQDRRRRGEEEPKQRPQAAAADDDGHGIIELLVALLGTYAAILAVANVFPETGDVLDAEQRDKVAAADSKAADAMIRKIVRTGAAFNTID